VGPILDTIVVSYDVEDMSYEESVTRKLIFTVPFYHDYGAQPLCLLDYYTVGL
jgi:hypothetical protein